jgi:hypothetical protein
MSFHFDSPFSLSADPEGGPGPFIFMPRPAVELVSGEPQIRS